MIQLYFLSIITSSLAGYLLFTGSEDREIDKSGFSLTNPTFHLVLGILCAVSGVLKLLSPIATGDSKAIYFFGDFLPASAGLLGGFLIIFGIYRQDTYSISESQKSLDAFAASLLKIRKPLGLALLGLAALHFLFPGALFL